mmetsp:Transcript_948/g.1485  ORF Transcript_948/g.1485 Transcript_948/m.1485 type:complete len:160 (+) Transcript_948:1625-2104(+)
MDAHVLFPQLYGACTLRTFQRLFRVTLCNISMQDGVSLLVNMSPVKIATVIHEWDLAEEKIVQKYSGQRQARFVIRSCFSGYNQMFVLSGSEDSNVYLWRRKNGSLIASLSGHSRTVNAVSWNPVDPFMFASASDDGTVRIWGSSSRTDRPAEPMNIAD